MPIISSIGGGSIRGFGMLAGGGVVIINRTQWLALAVVGVPISVKTSSGAVRVVTPVTYSGAKSIYLGNVNIAGTYFPGDSDSMSTTGSLSATAYQNLVDFGYLFVGGYIYVSNFAGGSESCCDPYRFLSFCGLGVSFPQILGSPPQPYYSAISSAPAYNGYSNSFTEYYTTDGSVNGGPGFSGTSAATAYLGG